MNLKNIDFFLHFATPLFIPHPVSNTLISIPSMLLKKKVKSRYGLIYVENKFPTATLK